MNPFVFVGVAAALVAAFAVGVLVRPVLGGRMVWPAIAATVATAVVTIGVGHAFALATPEFLIGIVAFALPVLLLLEAAAIASGADTFARWLLMLVWGLVVFPVAGLAPLALTSGCLAPDCGFEDFGAGLPLVVSAAAFVLLARLPAGVHERAQLDRASGRRAVAAGFLFWGSAGVWLASLEGAADDYVVRILISAAVVPIAGALGWLIVDVVRDTRVTTARSISLGLVAGMVAVLPGAVSVALPWSLVVGALAGALASLVYSLRVSRTVGLAARWAVTLLVAAAVGFLAPPVSGDTIGIIFAARASVLATPVLMFLGVVVFALGASAPVWLLVRHHATRERIPVEILVEE